MPVSASGPDRPNDRVQREVEEILEKKGRRESASPLRLARAPVRARASWLRISPGLLMLGALLLILLALALRDRAMPLVVGALVLFTAGYVWSMQRRNLSRRYGPARSSGKPEVYWRGEPVSQRKPIGKSNVVPFKETPAAKVKKKFGRR